MPVHTLNNISTNYFELEATAVGHLYIFEICFTYFLSFTFFILLLQIHAPQPLAFCRAQELKNKTVIINKKKKAFDVLFAARPITSLEIAFAVLFIFFMFVIFVDVKL